MSGAEHSADGSLDLSGEDQRADGEMPHAILLQMIGDDNTSEKGITQLRSFLSTYLQRIKESDLVRMLQGFPQLRGLQKDRSSSPNALKGFLVYIMRTDGSPCMVCVTWQYYRDPRSMEISPCALQTMRIGEHHIPAFDVWMAVLRNGGNDAVTNNKLWATIGRSVTSPPQ